MADRRCLAWLIDASPETSPTCAAVYVAAEHSFLKVCATSPISRVFSAIPTSETSRVLPAKIPDWAMAVGTFSRNLFCSTYSHFPSVKDSSTCSAGTVVGWGCGGHLLVSFTQPISVCCVLSQLFPHENSPPRPSGTQSMSAVLAIL